MPARPCASRRDCTLEGGALATRTRTDIRGDAPGNLAGNVRNVSQVYSAYAGPTLPDHVGPIDVNAAYRFGYTKVEAPDVLGVDPTAAAARRLRQLDQPSRPGQRRA